MKPSIFRDASGRSTNLDGLYRGADCFLICGGPSFGQLSPEIRAKLAGPGVLTMAMNNAVKSFRPNMWVSVDDPSHFIRSIWLDPKILKFTRDCHAKPDPKEKNSREVFDSDNWCFTGVPIYTLPSVVYMPFNNKFRAKHFLTEDTVNWGNHEKFGGGRSVMLTAVRILHALGIKNIYLLGCDMNMAPGVGYHFDQGRSDGSIKSNQKTYNLLKSRFAELRPILEKSGMRVFNCNPASELKAFDFVSVEQALADVTARNKMHGIDLAIERTSGLYDRKDKEERAIKEKTVTQGLIIPNMRRVRVMQGEADVWIETPWSEIKVGDRIKMWEADGKTRVKEKDVTKEWTVAAIEKVSENTYNIRKKHWDRTTHLGHMRAGTLMTALGAAEEPAPLDEGTSE